MESWWMHRKQHCCFIIACDASVHIVFYVKRSEWLRGRAIDSQPRGPGFESYAAMLKRWAIFFTVHCASSLSCIHEYLAIIDSVEYVYEQPSHSNCSIWLDASQRSCVWLNRSIREVKCFEQSRGLDTVLYKNLPLHIVAFVSKYLWQFPVLIN